MNTNQLIDGKSYNLGASTGRYVASGDYFSLGNCFVNRCETIYADNADPLYMRDVRESEIARNAIPEPVDLPAPQNATSALTAHTPGPWVIENEDETGSMIGTNGKTIATVWRSPENARLIASAPDLLAALQTALAFAVDVDSASQDDLDAVITQARAAIAKATGGSK